MAKFFVDVKAKMADADDEIIKRIAKAMGEELTSAVKKALSSLGPKLEELISFWIEQQPEIESLRGGLLQGDFGIIEGTEFGVTQEIIHAVSKSLEVSFAGFNKNLRGKLLINIQPTSFENILAITEPVVTENGTLIPWLKWLLFSGDAIMVLEYHVEYRGSEGRSRSGTGAVMVPGGVFRVRPEFAGTADNNFITRAFKGKESQIGRLLEEHISANMGR
jgi:hypothetical protein